jgi:hypothetical protein
MFLLTRPQREAVANLYARHPDGAASYREFRKRVYPMLAGAGCVFIQWRGMTVGIETDGYTHT